MERRVLLAIFLCFLVLYLWQAIFVKPVPKPQTVNAGQTSNAKPEPAKTATPSIASDSGEAAQPAAAPVATVVGESTERDIRVETDDVAVVFTNRGARLKSWRLKHYRDRDGQPQELVENQVPAQPLPFTLRTADEQINQNINTALYATQGPVPAGSASHLKFEYRDSAGVHVVKQFELGRGGYTLTFGSSVERGEGRLPAEIVWGPGLGDAGELASGIQAAQGILFQNGSVLRLPAGDIGEQPRHEGDFKYAGIDDNYFMAVALGPGTSKITYQPVTVPPPAGSNAARTLVSFALEPQRTDAVRFFIGPKDFDLLTSIDRDVATAVHFGRFAFIVVPLLRSLKWINEYVGNWGWSIVILTIMINAIMAPLRHKQVTSMRKMQEIQPEVKAIQDRYSKLKATDPGKQKMNQELMALYREKKVNPAAGCVPMLLTLPIVLAMWALLQTSIELRGAPWFGWIKDLSAADPYYILPVLMIATQFWQQWLMPATSADPAQQKMMLFMPVVMGFIFLFLPAGALVYYVVGTAFGIGQQYLTNYLIGPAPVRTVRPAAERKIKRVGSGKTDAASEGK